jgi:anti-sigma28 factor (negative regulator of flagellin synthesis)
LKKEERMRISNTNVVQPSESSIRATPGKPPQREDQVRLSSSTLVLSDQGKVERLAASVSAGTYRVSPFQIAGSMIHEMLSFNV